MRERRNNAIHVNKNKYKTTLITTLTIKTNDNTFAII